MKKTITVGFPIYNEEKNIENILSSILNQHANYYSMEKIILISDGSIDNTNQIIEKLIQKCKKIHFIKAEKRIGKAKRVNQMFKISESDVFVLLDADVMLPSKNVIDNLVRPFSKNNVDLTSGTALYIKPKSFFEKILAAGLDVWNYTKANSNNAEMYTCEGQIRAFSKKLYKDLKFPNKSADDIYPYLYCKRNNFTYKYVKHAKIYYKLPSTYKDYLSQHVRYLHSRKIHEANFKEDLIRSNFSIGFSEKITALIHYCAKNPLYLFLYLILLSVPKILVNFKNEGKSGTWAIITTTK